MPFINFDYAGARALRETVSLQNTVEHSQAYNLIRNPAQLSADSVIEPITEHVSQVTVVK